MILVIGGTKESNELTRILRDKNHRQEEPVSFKTSYGENVANGIVFLPRSLNCPMTTHLIRKYKVEILIDASPVYFKAASKKTMSACRMTGKRYIRFEPPKVSLEKGQICHRVSNIEKACEKAMGFGKVIFINIGNNNINVFTKRAAQENKKIVVRVSEPGGLTNSINFGIERHNILLIEGSFSEAFNKGLIKEYGISVLVTRELGCGNGTEQELSAAAAEGVPAILIDRPTTDCPETFTDYDKLVEEIF